MLKYATLILAFQFSRISNAHLLLLNLVLQIKTLALQINLNFFQEKTLHYLVNELHPLCPL